MAEQNEVFSSKIKYEGIFSFSDFYKFCYEYLVEELGFGISEDKYSEKVKGDTKEISIEWSGEDEVNDYFKYLIKVEFMIINLTRVEIERDGKREKTNKGEIELKIKGILISDYKGQYETKPLMRVMKDIYERWIIPSRVEKIEEKLASGCGEFLEQAKAYLDLEGKR